MEKGSKKPKPINEENTAFALYSPKRIKMNVGDFKYKIMDFAVDVPKDILSTFLIVPSLKVEGLQLTYHTNIGCGDKIRFELFNKNHEKKIDIKKREKLALFMTINDGAENFQTRYEYF